MNKSTTHHKKMRALLFFSIGLLLSCNSFAGAYSLRYATNSRLSDEVIKLNTDGAAEKADRKAGDEAEIAARQTTDEKLQNQINNIPLPIYYVIGDTGPAGGKVFFVSADGLHGLEAALSDQGTGIPWDNGIRTVTNAVRDGVHAGSLNTQLIINNQGAGNYAAQLCANYRGGGYGDWYLPSLAELALLFQQKDAVGKFDNDGYWSSTEVDASDAWMGFFKGGGQGNTLKSDKLGVRAIRAF